MFRLRLLTAVVSALLLLLVLSGCATRQGYQGAGVGALTGATAGILLDPDNRWRGALIGGGLGGALGGALTDIPRQNSGYYGPRYYDPYSYEPNYYGSPYPQYRGGYYRQPPYGYYREPGFYPGYNRQYPSYSSSITPGQGAIAGGLTGAAAGALIDDDNPWRGGLIGGFLGSLFGGSIGAINSGPSIPVLNP